MVLLWIYSLVSAPINFIHIQQNMSIKSSTNFKRNYLIFILLNLKLLGYIGIYTTFENIKESTFQENIVILENVKIGRSCIVLPVDIKNIIVFTVQQYFKPIYFLQVDLLRCDVIPLGKSSEIILFLFFMSETAVNLTYIKTIFKNEQKILTSTITTMC